MFLPFNFNLFLQHIQLLVFKLPKPTRYIVKISIKLNLSIVAYRVIPSKSEALWSPTNNFPFIEYNHIQNCSSAIFCLVSTCCVTIISCQSYIQENGSDNIPPNVFSFTKVLNVCNHLLQLWVNSYHWLVL